MLVMHVASFHCTKLKAFSVSVYYSFWHEAKFLRKLDFNKGVEGW